MRIISICYICQVTLWNMDTLQTESTPEEHKLVITDVRFRPNSSQLATASVDKSVRLWDAANVIVFDLFYALSASADTTGVYLTEINITLAQFQPLDVWFYMLCCMRCEVCLIRIHIHYTSIADLFIFCGSQTIVYKHIQGTTHLSCPLTSTLRRQTYFVSVILTMKFATGISTHSPVLVIPRFVNLSDLILLNLHFFYLYENYIDHPKNCLYCFGQGGTAQVRFQPRTGQLLAAASDKMVSIFDVETDRQTHSLQVRCL